jgi:hypothetical protein
MLNGMQNHVRVVYWERYLFYLYGVSIIITFRNLFRVIEYALGGKWCFFLVKDTMGFEIC